MSNHYNHTNVSVAEIDSDDEAPCPGSFNEWPHPSSSHASDPSQPVDAADKEAPTPAPFDEPLEVGVGVEGLRIRQTPIVPSNTSQLEDEGPPSSDEYSDEGVSFGVVGEGDAGEDEGVSFGPVVGGEATHGDSDHSAAQFGANSDAEQDEGVSFGWHDPHPQDNDRHDDHSMNPIQNIAFKPYSPLSDRSDTPIPPTPRLSSISPNQIFHYQPELAREGLPQSPEAPRLKPWGLLSEFEDVDVPPDAFLPPDTSAADSSPLLFSPYKPPAAAGGEQRMSDDGDADMFATSTPTHLDDEADAPGEIDEQYVEDKGPVCRARVVFQMAKIKLATRRREIVNARRTGTGQQYTDRRPVSAPDMREPEKSKVQKSSADDKAWTFMSSTIARDRVDRSEAPRAYVDDPAVSRVPRSPSSPLSGRSSLAKRDMRSWIYFEKGSRAESPADWQRDHLPGRGCYRQHDGAKARTPTNHYSASAWELRARMHALEHCHGPTWRGVRGLSDWNDYAEATYTYQAAEQKENGLLQRFALINAAMHGDRQRGLPRDSPMDLAVKALSWYKSNGQKRRSQSCPAHGGSGGKRQKKAHRKFTSPEEAEEYARQERQQSQGPEAARDSEDIEMPDADSQSRRSGGLVLCGPKAATDGTKDFCIVCKLPKWSLDTAQCSKCGWHQFCGDPCKQRFERKDDGEPERYCCRACKTSNETSREREQRTNIVPKKCVECKGTIHRVFPLGLACVYCGRHQFCSALCRDHRGAANCTPDCQERHDDAKTSDNPDMECAICDDVMDPDFETAVPCYACGEMRFCCIECKDSQGDLGGVCDEICRRFNVKGGESEGSSSSEEEKKAPPKPKEKARSSSINAGKSRVTDGARDRPKAKAAAPPEELSILNDPRNYDFDDDTQMPDAFQSSRSPAPKTPPGLDIPTDRRTAEDIIDHRLAAHGRLLEYRVERDKPRSRRWIDARGLHGQSWTDRMAAYWTSSEQRRRQRKGLEARFETKFGVRLSAFGRCVLHVEIEGHRALLFKTVDFADVERKGRGYWIYGASLEGA